MNSGALSIEPGGTFIWTQESLLNGPGALFSEFQIPNLSVSIVIIYT